MCPSLFPSRLQPVSIVVVVPLFGALARHYLRDSDRMLATVEKHMTPRLRCCGVTRRRLAIMRLPHLTAVMMTLGLVVVGCGWSPPSPPAPSTQACGSSDAPSPDTVAQAIATLPQAQWKETSSGHTPDCRLNWVVVGSGDASDSPHQVLFFD